MKQKGRLLERRYRKSICITAPTRIFFLLLFALMILPAVSFAELTPGTVWTWGNATYLGRLSNGPSIGFDATPAQVEGLADVVDIVGSYNYSLLVKADGTVWTTGQGRLFSQVAGFGGIRIVAVAGGANHRLALSDDGKVFCWGRNEQGQLGDGTNSNSNTPVQVVGEINNHRVVAIEGGFAFSMAVTEEGRVYTWGQNDGQLGNGTFISSNVPAQVVGELATKKVVSVTTTPQTANVFALTDEGTVYAWGYNARGRLGLGFWTSWDVFGEPVPALVESLSNVVSISAGSPNIALDGEGVLWYAANGAEDYPSYLALPWQPIAGFPVLDNAVEVATNLGHAFVLLDDGSLLGWGDNYSGQIGDGTPLRHFDYSEYDDWHKEQLTPVLLLSNVAKVEAGHSHSIALIGSANEPPVLDLIGNQFGNEGELLAFTVSATDPDAGDTLTYSLTADLPVENLGNVFDSTTGLFSWTPTYDDEGVYTAEFYVMDNGDPLGEDSETITITIANTNRAPVFEPIGFQEVSEGVLEPLTFQVMASDPDDNGFTFSTGPLPPNSAFDPATGIFTFAPNIFQAGDYDVTFYAIDDDPQPETGELVMSISVLDVLPDGVAGQLLDAITDGFDLPNSVENSYSASAGNALNFIESGQTGPATNNLQALIQKAGQDLQKGNISQAEHDYLVTLASDLITLLGQ